MSYTNIPLPISEFDFYYKTKNELYYLENYLSLLYRNNTDNIKNSTQKGSAIVSDNNSMTPNTYECKYYNILIVIIIISKFSNGYLKILLLLLNSVLFNINYFLIVHFLFFLFS